MSLAASLMRLAASSESLTAWRRGALELLADRLPHEAAFFHEFSPRVPLDRAALVGISAEALERSRAHWDDYAVSLGLLRERALAQGGAATDHEAFPRGSRARARWQTVARPLRLRSALMGHLVLRRRMVAGLLLGRRRLQPFTTEDRRTLSRLLPVLTVADALLQSLETGATPRGPAVALECVDQRLTPRQRDIVVQVALGHTNAEIGQALGISPNTVRNLLVQVCTRLDAANRAEVVRLAVLR